MITLKAGLIFVSLIAFLIVFVVFIRVLLKAAQHSDREWNHAFDETDSD